MSMTFADVDVFNQSFWQEEAQRIHWQQAFTQVAQRVEGSPRSIWFPRGTTNLCYNALDRHLAEWGERCAIIHRNYCGETLSISYRELCQQVNALSIMLTQRGIKKGDRVLILLSMTPMAVVAMLACVRIGAVHVVVYSETTSDALSQRINACQPALLLHNSDKRGRDILPCIPVSSPDMSIIDIASGDFYVQFSALKGQSIPCTWVDSDHPSHILFTSGTTGQPKGIVRDTGGYAVALLASLHHLFQLSDDEIFFTTADVGWVTGHSYGVYAPLLGGLTTVICESSPVNKPGKTWWSMVEDLGITRMLTIAGAIRLARQQGKICANMTSLRTLYLAGEPLDPATDDWVNHELSVRCENHYWQTESGWPLLAGQGMGLNNVFSRTAGVINPLTGDECQAGETGMLVVHDTLGPGGMLTLWQNDQEHDQSYWRFCNGRWLYQTQDYALNNGKNIIILGRLDDVINIGGKRLSTSEVEHALVDIERIVEVVAVRIPHHLLGEMLALYIVTDEIDPLQEKTLKKAIRQRVVACCGRFALPRKIYFKKSLPKTFSGKYLRRQLLA